MLDSIQSVLNLLLSPAGVAGLSIVLEVFFRLVKSDKPRSILLGLAKALNVVADLSSKLAGLLDKVVPQRLV